MRTFVKYLLAFLGGALISVGIIAGLIFTDIINLKKLKYQLPYHPLVTKNRSVVKTSLIKTNQFNLRSVSYSLPSIDGQFISGGGAVLPLVDGGILVLNKSGDLYKFKITTKGPIIVKLDSAIKTNNDYYGQYARSKGYAVRPGKNIGFAGLGMRAIDLLHVKKHSLIAVSYTQWQVEKNCAVLKVSVRAVDEQRNFMVGSVWRDVFETRPCLGLGHRKKKPFAGHQSGGRMIERENGNFLVSVGDFKHDGWNREDKSDDVAADFGKIFEVNPLSGERLEFTNGHRNPQGLMKDRAGRVWSSEHGPVGGDELNLVVKGADYGWPKVTLGVNCSGCKGLVNGRHEGYQAPVYAWSPAIGVSNLIEINGIDDSWHGNFLVASLVGQSLHRLIIADGRVQLDEQIPVGDRIRDLFQAKNGDIVLWSDSGQMTFISKAIEKSPVENYISSLSPPVRIIIARCGQCHVFEKGTVRVGAVNLWDVFGREIAGTNFPRYSDAFKSAGGIWDEKNLNAFLKNPQMFIPNNAMADEGVLDHKTRAEVVGFLLQLR